MGRTSRKRQSKSAEALKNNSVNSEDLYEKLRIWMLSNKWKASSNLIPHVFETTGRGLMTLDKIDTNQILIQVPKSLLITSFMVSQSPIKILFSRGKSYSAQCVLAAFLIYENHLGQSSFWKPYLDTLPTSYSNPEFCSKNEKNLLPNCIKNQSEIMSRRLKSNYLSLIESIKLLDDICAHCQISFYDIFTYHKFAWAYYTVNTRAVYINDKKHKVQSINIYGDDNLALAPLLDLFNHSHETVAEAQLVSLSNGKEFYQIKALKSYQPNMQVFINYGSHNNLTLYLEYGFFILNNPLDQVFFNLSDIQKCHQVSTSACNFLKMNGFDKNMAFTVNGLNYNAKIALFIVTANISKESYWKEKIYCEKFNDMDLELLNNLGLTVLKCIKNEFISLLENMTSIVHRTESFSIAISLTKEYVNIIETSLKSIKSFKYD